MKSRLLELSVLGIAPGTPSSYTLKVSPLPTADVTAVAAAQTMAMAAYLLESAPAKFLELLKRLRGGEHEDSALEEAYRMTLEELEQRYGRWILARK